MEAKRKLIRSFVGQGLKLDVCLDITRLSRSTYYYRSNGKRKGKCPSKTTLYKGRRVSNQFVVNRIHKILEQPFIDYGYKRTTYALKDQGFQIGKSKVYRLMKEHGLLHPKIKANPIPKRGIVWYSPQPQRPFHILEIDFKYVWIEGEQRFAYLTTILDTFHRHALAWGLFPDMKTDRVQKLIHQLVDQHLIPNGVDPNKVELNLRTDNGSQFRSKKYLDTLKDIGVKSQYIPNATPQLNGHIEAFHNTVTRLICHKIELESLVHANQVFDLFFKTYNAKRIMKAITYKCPVQFLHLWKQGRIEIRKVKGKNKFYLRGENQAHLVSSP